MSKLPKQNRNEPKSQTKNKDGTNSLKQNKDGLIGTKTKQRWT